MIANMPDVEKCERPKRMEDPAMQIDLTRQLQLAGEPRIAMDLGQRVASQHMTIAKMQLFHSRKAIRT